VLPRKCKSMPSVHSHKQNSNAVSCVFLVFAAVMFAVLTVAALSVRIELTKVNDEYVLLSEQLDEINEENTRLIIEISSADSFDNIEGAAEYSLGLSCDGKTQVIEIEVKKEDRAEITREANQKECTRESWISSISNIFRKEK